MAAEPEGNHEGDLRASGRPHELWRSCFFFSNCCPGDRGGRLSEAPCVAGTEQKCRGGSRGGMRGRASRRRGDRASVECGGATGRA